MAVVNFATRKNGRTTNGGSTWMPNRYVCGFLTLAMVVFSLNFVYLPSLAKSASGRKTTTVHSSDRYTSASSLRGPGMNDGPKVVNRTKSAFPSQAQMGWNQVQAILKALPEDGNLLVWGLGFDSVFWNQVTSGRVVFLEDGSWDVNLLNGKRWFDHITAQNPQLEAYAVDYTTTNSDEAFLLFSDHPDTWSRSLEFGPGMFPQSVRETNWDVILVDAPLGTPNQGPGRYQSLYMAKQLAELSLQASIYERVHVFVDDYERMVEREFSQIVFDMAPVDVIHRTEQGQVNANEQAHFIFELSRSIDTQPPMSSTKTVVRDRAAFPKQAQMGWEQVERILSVLPEDGNLLVWGLGRDSVFWHQVTSGRVVFLEDGSWDVNLLNGKRWFDFITASNPQLEAYTVDYTTSNTAATFQQLSGHPELWDKALNLTANFPAPVLPVAWDVILVDAPLGYGYDGPGRYQSLYMTKLLAQTKLQGSASSTVHVFVDDYERKVEREFSQEVFDRAPVKVMTRVGRGDEVNANEQAHFVLDNQRKVVLPQQSEAAVSVALDSWIVLVEVNNGFYDFFLNWLAYYNKLDLSLTLIVIAEDDVVYEALQRDIRPVQPNMLVQRSALHLNATAFDHNTTSYKAMVSARPTHVLQQLEQGRNVIYTDIDTVWRSSPLPYLKAAMDKETDALFSVDLDECWWNKKFKPYYCTGFMVLVSNDRTKGLIRDWEQALAIKPDMNQPTFNDILHTSTTVRHAPLPRSTFPSGEYYFQKFNATQRADAVVVHNNFLVGRDPKRQRFVNRGLWNVSW